MKSVAFTSAIAMAALCITAQTLVADIIYSAAEDFSATSNPTGVWSYGESINPADVSSFLRYAYFGKDNADAAPAHLLDAWYRNPTGLSIPAVLHNGTSAVVQFTNPGTTSVTYEPGELAFHPGDFGAYSVIRFTAPSTDLYSVQSSFRAVDAEASTNVIVLANGNAIFGGDVDKGFPLSFDGAIFLNTGQTLDFTVGARGSYFSDTTGIAVRISAVPEPGSLLPASLFAMVIIRLRRKRRSVLV